MSVNLFNRINLAIRRVEYAIALLFGRRYPPDGVCFEVVNSVLSQPPVKNVTLSDIIGDGFLWAVPKHRRTVEKRLQRKFGDPKYVLKVLLPKSTLRVCNVCGDDHEVGVLCPTCYKKVIDETKQMQDAIQNELKLAPVENEVVVLYDGEKDDKTSEFWKGKRIVEMNKPRPSWFSKNLMQETTQEPATTTDVKPPSLG